MTVAGQEFPAAPLDRSTRVFTLAMGAALLGLALSLPTAVEQNSAVAQAIGLAAPIGILGLAYGFGPRAYSVTPDGTLRMDRRWFGSKSFRVTSAQTVAALFALGGIGLSGSGGAFGWYGLFWHKGRGKYHAYVTDRSKLVACHGPDGLVVISPADPDAFLATLPATP
jgi:hypothetical protein